MTFRNWWNTGTYKHRYLPESKVKRYSCSSCGKPLKVKKPGGPYLCLACKEVPAQQPVIDEKEKETMKLTAQTEKEFERIPAGTHIARCYLIADLGTQEIIYQGEAKQQRKIVFVFETPTKLMENGKPFTISETFTASIGTKAKLRSVLENWKGSAFTPQEEAGFDPIYFLNRPCFLSVVHETSQKTGKTYANIGAVMQLAEGVSAPQGINGPVYFSLEEYDQASFDALPEWIQNKIKLSPEYQVIIAAGDAPDLQEVPWVDDVAS